MTEKTAEETLNNFMMADKDLVDSYNHEFWDGHAPIEAQIKFLSLRLNLTGSALATVAKKLIEEQKHNDAANRTANTEPAGDEKT